MEGCPRKLRVLAFGLRAIVRISITKGTVQAPVSVTSPGSYLALDLKSLVMSTFRDSADACGLVWAFLSRR